MSSLNITNVGRIEWGLVVMGFSLWMLLGWYPPILNEDIQKGVGCIPNIGYLARGRLGMGCVLDVVRGVLDSIKGAHRGMGRANS